MRKIILLLSLALLSAFPAFSQNGGTFYNVCITGHDVSDSNLRSTEYNVKVSADAFTFTGQNGDYTAIRVPDTNFFYYENVFYIYIVDDKSFFVIPVRKIESYVNNKSDDEGWRYYHANQRLGHETDDNKRCALGAFDKAIAEIVPHYKQKMEAYKQKMEEDRQKQEAANKVFAARSKIVFTDYVKNFQSKRNDPAITKEILNWWQTVSSNPAAIPILRISLINTSWGFLRNEYGIVTGKSIDAMIVYKSKQDNTCFAGWRSFQHEAIGGGTFDTELKDWLRRLNAAQYDFLDLPENRRMEAGPWYEVDCAAFPSVPLR